jgi:hypothetical protein
MSIYPLSYKERRLTDCHLILYDKPWYVGQLGRERGFEGTSSGHCRRDEIRYNFEYGNTIGRGESAVSVL